MKTMSYKNIIHEQGFTLIELLIVVVILAILAGILFIPATFFAQAPLCSISGSVLDPSGASIPGAFVTLTNRSDGSTVQVLADRLGAFRFDDLTPAYYSLSAQVPDFRLWKEEFELTPGQHRVVRADLQIAPSVLIQERVMVGPNMRCQRSSSDI